MASARPPLASTNEGVVMRTHVVTATAMLALYASVASAQSTTQTPSASPAPAAAPPAVTVPGTSTTPARPARPAQNPSADEGDEGETRPFPAALAGAWKSATDRLPLTTAFDESVWGKNASSVRDVELTSRPDGGAVLTITRKVVDARERAIAGSTSSERAELTIAEGRSGIASRIDYATRVTQAERRYPDSPDDPWAIDGLRVVVSTLESNGATTLEIRVDTPEGRGSFWETLRRTGAANRRAAR
jgi:hypothetical protein